MSATPVIAALLPALLAPPATAAWRPPVAGALTRPFAVTTNPFAAGQHRGIDLGAAPGTPVRAPCAGRVAVAGRVGTSGGVVTLRCGRWRVTHLPLATIAVRAGAPVARGTRLGTVARGATHAGLHLGVRRTGDRFGYVDPLRFLAPAPTTPVPPLGRAPRGRRLPPPLPPAPLTSPRAVPLTPRSASPRAVPLTPRSALPRGVPLTLRSASPRAVPLTARSASPRGASLAAHLTSPLSVPLAAPLTSPLATSLDVAARSDPRRLAPWPAWLGLALVLAGAGIGVRRSRGTRTRTRRRIRGAVRLNE